jgi:hypothetical protein
MGKVPSSIQACHTFCIETKRILNASATQKVRHTLNGWSEKYNLKAAFRLPQPYSGTAFLCVRNL